MFWGGAFAQKNAVQQSTMQAINEILVRLIEDLNRSKIENKQVNQASNVANTAPKGGATIEQRLKELDKLKQKGLITDSEYREKRAQILSDF